MLAAACRVVRTSEVRDEADVPLFLFKVGFISRGTRFLLQSRSTSLKQFQNYRENEYNEEAYWNGDPVKKT